MGLKFYTGEVKKVEIPEMKGKERLDFCISAERVMPAVLDYDNFNRTLGLVLGVVGGYVPLEGEEAEQFLSQNPKYKMLLKGLVKKENYGLNGVVEREIVKVYSEKFTRILNEFGDKSYIWRVNSELNGRRFYEMTGAFLLLSGIRSDRDEITYRQGLLETLILSGLAVEGERLNEHYKNLILELYGLKK